METAYGVEAVKALIDGKYLKNNDNYYRLNRVAYEMQCRDNRHNDWTTSNIMLNDIIGFNAWEVVIPEDNIEDNVEKLKAMAEGKTLKDENGFYKINIKTNEVTYSPDNYTWAKSMDLIVNDFLKKGKYTVVE